MSKYRKIDCVGWWEDAYGARIKVIGIDGKSRAYLYKDENGEVRGTCEHVDLILHRKHLPDCTGWKWQPEPKVKEIEFPDWILPGWNYVTRDNGNDAPELWCERPELDAGIWNHTLNISIDRTLDFVDTSWVPPVPMDGWERAIWKRKQKEK